MNPSSFIHEIPEDLEKAILNSTELENAWNKLTPLAKNEWICWVTIVVKLETRIEHIERLKIEVLEGQKRPCCWPGCPHRRPNAAKWFSKNAKK